MSFNHQNPKEVQIYFQLCWCRQRWHPRVLLFLHGGVVSRHPYPHACGLCFVLVWAGTVRRKSCLALCGCHHRRRPWVPLSSLEALTRNYPSQYWHHLLHYEAEAEALLGASSMFLVISLLTTLHGWGWHWLFAVIVARWVSFLGVSGSSMLSLLAVIENQISGVFPLLLPFPLKDFLPLGGVGLWYVELGCDVGVSIILKGGHRFSVSSSLRILHLPLVPIPARRSWDGGQQRDGARGRIGCKGYSVIGKYVVQWCR